jgi:hypothetical protein
MLNADSDKVRRDKTLRNCANSIEALVCLAYLTRIDQNDPKKQDVWLGMADVELEQISGSLAEETQLSIDEV